MRVRLLSLALAIITPSALIADHAQLLKELREKVQGALCAGQPGDKAHCVAEADAVVVNRLTADENLWAFSFTVKGLSVPTLKATQAIQTSIETLNARPLEVSKERVALIFYFRSQKEKLLPVGPEEFHKLTLNPKNKIVARLRSDFVLSGGTLVYEAPPLWESEGLAASTTSTMRFTGNLKENRRLRFEILNLDDQGLPSVSITGCKLGATPAAAVCDAVSVAVNPGAAFGIALEVKAARKIKSEQPAFKIVIKYAEDADKPEKPPLAQLAIPFKPQPNYFLFGVTGFLVGGLIAAMMLFMRRRGEKPAAIKLT